MRVPRRLLRSRWFWIVVGASAIGIWLVIGPAVGLVVDLVSGLGAALRGLAFDPFGRLLLFNLVLVGWLFWIRRRRPDRFGRWLGRGRERSVERLLRHLGAGDAQQAGIDLEAIGPAEEGSDLHRFVRAAGRRLQQSESRFPSSKALTRAEALRPIDPDEPVTDPEEFLRQRPSPLSLVPLAEWEKSVGHDDLAVALSHAALARVGDDPEAVARLAEVLERDEPPRAIPRSHLTRAVRADLSTRWPLIS